MFKVVKISKASYLNYPLNITLSPVMMNVNELLRTQQCKLHLTNMKLPSKSLDHKRAPRSNQVNKTGKNP